MTFDEKIKAFNRMYGLPCHDLPHLAGTRADIIERLQNFKNILLEEINEVDEIITQIQDGYPAPVDALVDIADWLGDIQVYCASEMRKYGLENAAILETIMASNMSKLDENGKPIYDERGKVMKGPNYWKPEEQIKRYIQATLRQAMRGYAS